MICQVCNTTIRSLKVCPTCLLPVEAISAIADPNLRDDLLRWAQVKHREATTRSSGSRVVDVPHVNRNSERFASERAGFGRVPVAEPAYQSGMKAQCGGEDVQSLDSLKSELAALNYRITSTEGQQLGSKTEVSKLLQKSQALEQDIEKVTEAVKRISSFFDQQNKKNHELAEQCCSNQEASERYEQQIQVLIEEQKQQVAELNLLKSLLTNPHVVKSTVNPAAVISSTNTSVVASPNVSFTNEELNLLKEYNSNPFEVPVSLRDRAATVTIDDETFNRLRNGDESNIAFKSDRKGNYFVITRGGFRYLVPTKSKKITALTYTITKAIYKCSGFSENYKDFSLLKPALVSEESTDSWKLSQAGILEFT
jgi:hypothetical protein